MESKNSFFSVILSKNSTISGYELEKIKDEIDLLLGSIQAKKPLYEFRKLTNDEIIIFFETDNRKRRGQVNRACEKIFNEDIDFKVNPYTKTVYNLDIHRIKNNKNFKEIENINSKLFEEYSGKDIAIFNSNHKNWHEWQNQLYNKIFNENGQIKEPDDRKIISIVDRRGNCGKSSFFKWLYVKYPQSVGRCSYGSSSQLRSSLVNIGKRKIYIIDLSRSKGFLDREEDLLAAVEELKSGTIFTSMYGSGNQLIMEPPHIIISSNYFLNYSLLSEDRWDVYKIGEKLNLEEVKPLEIKKELKEQNKKTLLEEIEKKLLKKRLMKEVTSNYYQTN